MSLRLCAAGFNILVAACAGEPSPSLPGVQWPILLRAGVALSHGSGRLSAPSGVCGGLLGLDRRLVSLALVLWCVLVRPAVFCPALRCCALLVCTVLRCALLCRAVPRLVVLRRCVAACAVLCRATPCSVVLCRVVGFLVVVRCTAVHCGAVCRVASCCGVYRYAVVCGGPFSPPLRLRVRWALVRLARLVVQDAGRGYGACRWLGGAVTGGVAGCRPTQRSPT